MDRCCDSNILLVRSGSRDPRSPWKLQQIQQQRVQGCTDSLFGEFFDEYVRRIRNFLRRWIYGT